MVLWLQDLIFKNPQLVLQIAKSFYLTVRFSRKTLNYSTKRLRCLISLKHACQKRRRNGWSLKYCAKSLKDKIFLPRNSAHVNS